MMYLVAYGTAFILKQGKQELPQEEATTLVGEVLSEIGIQGQNLGASYDGKHLVPSVNFQSQTHKKCELTGMIRHLGYEIKRVPKKRAVS